MKRLFHLSTTSKQLDLFDKDWEQIKGFIEKNRMDGIEVGLTLDYPLEQIPAGIVEGVHLSFYPMWLDFWRQDQVKLQQLFEDEEAIKSYYGGLEPAVLIESYKKQYRRAKALGAKYMVFHVSHVLPEDSFTWQFDYTDHEVMEATLELVNAVFEAEEDGPMLLFENLWWPGLTYLNPELTQWFIEGVQYKNKGYLVDVSHLTLTNATIGNEKQAYEYIKKVITQLGETKKWIKAVHLNKALPKFYMGRSHHYLLEQYQKAKDKKQQLMILKKHINALDGHVPFDHPLAASILELMDPMYCVYETAPSSRYELAYFIKCQNEALKMMTNKND
ncbi:TIM barrel protein [Cellulosilyticum lentocellum]|uniref:Xylose isomerase domain-containing protein TIM barrel n=1 Tax=Cellulosilyticum lentocellum (strain ATCC 49066 / DSM 5427 / NCIMB 11756 / RHM5) TaxID=642492 RepID=F2JLI4_CELLD|nr:TIM barrel protein [Cellulosilyticum lentocellum]ADZ83375.1 Xylose isomerase domain-containing protein TIM barrel [Cellulosilyticum lentocellum DSM 5427]